MLRKQQIGCYWTAITVSIMATDSSFLLQMLQTYGILLCFISICYPVLSEITTHPDTNSKDGKRKSTVTKDCL